MRECTAYSDLGPAYSESYGQPWDFPCESSLVGEVTGLPQLLKSQGPSYAACGKESGKTLNFLTDIH